MAITRAHIDRFRSNLAKSFSTWQPIHSFKVKGSKVKVTAYVTGNADWLRNLCEFLAYLTLRSGCGTTCSAWVVARRNFPKRPKTQYFRTRKTRNPENANNTPDRLSRSRVAFELQCFRNCTLSSYVLCFVTFNGRFLSAIMHRHLINARIYMRTVHEMHILARKREKVFLHQLPNSAVAAHCRLHQRPKTFSPHAELSPEQISHISTSRIMNPEHSFIGHVQQK